MRGLIKGILKATKILAGWGQGQDLEAVSRLGNGLDLFEKIDALQSLA